MIAFGPVPSRRLGQSLGVNHIPPKVCSYDCIYCQVGETTERPHQRRAFYPVADIHAAVAGQLAQVRRTGGRVDYLSLVPDGEPTLDSNLGAVIRSLQAFGLPIAVFTNSSLLSDPAVRAEISLADWVSVKIDAVTPAAWRRVNRPARSLDPEAVLQGILDFAREYAGTLVTETMLVRDINDAQTELAATGDFVAKVGPRIAYLAAPTRPPALEWVRAPDEATLHWAYQYFAERLPNVELLIGFAEVDFQPSGDPEKDLLHITAVHPMREAEARRYAEDCGAPPTLPDTLADAGLLKKVAYGDGYFYIRKYLG